VDVQLQLSLARRCVHMIELTLKPAKRILFLYWSRKLRSPKLVIIPRPSRYMNPPHVDKNPYYLVILELYYKVTALQYQRGHVDPQSSCSLCPSSFGVQLEAQKLSKYHLGL
jgi:hypothetical protein